MVMRPRPKPKAGLERKTDVSMVPVIKSQSAPDTNNSDLPDVAAESETLISSESASSQSLKTSEPVLTEADFVPARSPSPRWLLLALGLCAAVSSLAVGAFIWLLSIPPAPDCENISNFSPDRERLYCAQQAAASGDLPELLDGIEMLDEWTPQHPLHNEAQDWLAEWSDAVLAIARTKMYDSDIEGAIELASQIPPSSPIYDEAQATIGEWQAIWDSGKYLYDKARMAIRDKDWNSASQYILELSKAENSYWRIDQTADLTRKMRAEKQAQTALVQARAQAKPWTPNGLSAAVATVSSIDRSTYAWWEAQADMNKWSEALLVVGLQKWQSGQVDEAIAIGQRVALNPNLQGTGADLTKIAQARKHAFSSGSTWTTSPKHLWHLMEAMALARQIQPESKYYAQAQESLKSWDQQLQDLTKLQAAQVAADLGQKPMLEYAIAQAQQVEAGRPRRLQAQTLIAHWNQEVERMEDEPHLVKARRLAAKGTVSSLKAAIAAASKVHLGRQLRPEAQGLIFVWNQDIQTIEDQPILNEAYALARQGNLSGAIAQAGNVRPGRALYTEAQGAIASWRAEIRAAEEARRREAEARQRELEAERPDSTLQLESSPESTPDPFSVKPSVKLDRLVEEAPVQPSPPSAPIRDFYQPRPSAPEQRIELERRDAQPELPPAQRPPEPSPRSESPMERPPAERPTAEQSIPFPSPEPSAEPTPFPSPDVPAAVETAPEPSPAMGSPMEQGAASSENLQSRTPSSTASF